MPADAPFSITQEAKRAITRLVDKYESRSGKVVIPAVLWIDSGLNDRKVVSQPAIGFYDDRSAVQDDILIADELEIVLAVSDEDKFRFEGKTLDYESGRFLLR